MPRLTKTAILNEFACSRINRIQSRFSSLYWLGFVSLVLAYLAIPVNGQQPSVKELESDRLIKALESKVERVIKHVEPSVVAISRVKPVETQHLRTLHDPFMELRRPTQISTPSDPGFVASAVGAGVVIDAKGLILTHRSLIIPGHDHWVTTSDNKSYRARPIALDPRSGMAVLAIRAKKLKVIKFGDGAKAKRGNFTITLGNPFSVARDGKLSARLSMVANTGRKARFYNTFNRSRNMIYEHGGFLETDAKLGIGDLGSPVLNLKGEMIALTVAAPISSSEDPSTAFAIPVDRFFRRAVKKLKAGEEVEYGLLGVQFKDRYLGPSDGRKGVGIGNVIPGGPAFAAHLQPNDIITHINDVLIDDADALILNVGRQAPNSKVEIRFLRYNYNGRGTAHRVTTKLTKSPTFWAEPLVTKFQPAPRGIHVDYASANANYSQSAYQGLVDLKGCVSIRKVEFDSIGWKVGLRQGMFVSHVAGKRVSDPDKFRKLILQASDSVEIRLTLPESQQPVRLLPAESFGG